MEYIEYALQKYGQNFFLLPEDPAYSTRNKYRVLFFSAVFGAGTIDILWFFFPNLRPDFMHLVPVYMVNLSFFWILFRFFVHHMDHGTNINFWLQNYTNEHYFWKLTNGGTLLKTWQLTKGIQLTFEQLTFENWQKGGPFWKN